MYEEVIVALALVIAFFIIHRIQSNLYSTRDEIYIAQFSPTCVKDIARYVRVTRLNKLKINIYIDFTLNNIRGTRNLHKLGKQDLNVYQRVLHFLLEGFGNMNIPISMCGFGDLETQDTDVFSVHQTVSCSAQAVEHYRSTVKTVEMSGPRCFIPSIRHAIEESKKSGQHIIFIISSGLPENMALNRENIIDASWSDVLVIIIGVGAGPWRGISELSRYSDSAKFSNVTYFTLDMYPDKIDFLRNVVLTAKDMQQDRMDELERVEQGLSRTKDD